MMILTVIFVVIAAFLGGIAVGSKPLHAELLQKTPEPDEDLIKIQKEYENFLNYDGSVQQ